MYNSNSDLLFIDEYFSLKWEFFQAVAVLVLLYGCTIWILIKLLKMENKQRCCVLFWTNSGSSILWTAFEGPLTFNIHKLCKMSKTYWALRTNSEAKFCYELLQMDTSILVDYQKGHQMPSRWLTKDKWQEWELKEFVLVVSLDDNDDRYYRFWNKWLNSLLLKKNF